MSCENDVYTKTKELGEALRSSIEFSEMQSAMKRVTKNTMVSGMLDRYIEIDRKIEEETNRENKDMQQVSALSEEMELLGEKLKSYSDVADMLETKEAFSKLVYQVNTMLQFIVNGIKPKDGGPSCDDCQK